MESLETTLLKHAATTKISITSLYAKKYTIATIGSHSALQILKGARDEGFQTFVIHTPRVSRLYHRFGFIDRFLEVGSYGEVPAALENLKKEKLVIVPHGSFVAYLGIEGNKNMSLPYFGNKAVLDWEGDRDKQRHWLEKAGLTLPRQFSPQQKIQFPVIVKSHGAAGGKGYFIAHTQKELDKKLVRFGKTKYTIQEYIVGVPLYIQYFYSPLDGKLEIVGMDRRYETNVDGIGRIPASEQSTELEPSFVVVGNSPLVLRESMLEEVYTMGEAVIAASQQLIDQKGLFGPFCLETIITPDQKLYCIEISCRIVAGTNLFTHGSPYTWLEYDEPMSTGRRIAREIKKAIGQGNLNAITT